MAAHRNVSQDDQSTEVLPRLGPPESSLGVTASARRERDAAERPRDPFAGPWFNSQTACEYLCFTGSDRLHSLYRWLDANGIPRQYRSPKRLLIAKRDIDQALRLPGTARRRNRIQAA